jgi:hypothetical protein
MFLAPLQQTDLWVLCRNNEIESKSNIGLYYIFTCTRGCTSMGEAGKTGKEGGGGGKEREGVKERKNEEVGEERLVEERMQL